MRLVRCKVVSSLSPVQLSTEPGGGRSWVGRGEYVLLPRGYFDDVVAGVSCCGVFAFYLHLRWTVLYWIQGPLGLEQAEKALTLLSNSVQISRIIHPDGTYCLDRHVHPAAPPGSSRSGRRRPAR